MWLLPWSLHVFTKLSFYLNTKASSAPVISVLIITENWTWKGDKKACWIHPLAMSFFSPILHHLFVLLLNAYDQLPFSLFYIYNNMCALHQITSLQPFLFAFGLNIYIFVSWITHTKVGQQHWRANGMVSFMKIACTHTQNISYGKVQHVAQKFVHPWPSPCWTAHSRFYSTSFL